MNHYFLQETSSFETASYSDNSTFCHIALEVFNTSILRSPLQTRNNFLKSFILVEDSIILSHKESFKVRIATTKRELARSIQDGFEIITEVKIHKKQSEKHSFTLQRNFDSINFQAKESKTISALNLNSLVFYSIRKEGTLSKIQQIKQGDFIKLGKEIYNARTFIPSQEIKSIKMTNLFPVQNKSHYQLKNKQAECKVCLMSEGQNEKDYILSPCKCSGTCSFIHVECLKNWINSKIQVGKGDQKLHSYDMSRFACEICKQKYPETLQVEQSFIDITPEISLHDDTLVLTKIFPTEDGKKNIHKVCLQKGKELTIGRHYYNELILQDMSISRNHATICRSGEDGKFYLIDENSRFGSFINLKSPICELKEATLISCKQTFKFRLLGEHKDSKNSFSDDSVGEITEQKMSV